MDTPQKEPGFYLSLIVVILFVIGVIFFSYQDKKSEPIPETPTENVVSVRPIDQYPIDGIPRDGSSPAYDVVSFNKNEKGYIDGVTIGSMSQAELQVDPYEIEVINPISRSATEIYKVKTEYPSGLVDSGLEYYKIGKVGNGAFAGKDIYSYISGGDMGGPYLTHYLIPLDNDLFFAFAEDGKDGFTLKHANYPDQAIFPVTNHVLKKGYAQILYEPKITSTFSSEGRTFNIINNSCVATEMPDGRFMSYTVAYPIVSGEDHGLLDITFNDGTKNKDRYSYSLSACNYFCTSPSFANITPEDLENGVYSAVGVTPDGKKVYAHTDPNNSEYVTLYNDKNTSAYIVITDEYHALDHNKYTYAEFVASYPMLFWQDAFGNWIKFSNERFQPMAEKCKPVIYLYPEENTVLNVQVTPNGGFTKTIPEYPEGGWNVLATPDSKITDLLTDTVYPYLYWSGIGNNYPVDYTIGSVVTKEDISSFLDEKLVELGLNNIEIADLKEYWVPRLSESNYYQIYFLTKEQIDAMDPLQITPLKPDNIIRVMLTARPLDTPIELREQVLPPMPRRDGFTVVEWGGVLLR